MIFVEQFFEFRFQFCYVWVFFYLVYLWDSFTSLQCNPQFFIQSSPSRGFVFFVVIRSSSSFRVPLISTFAVVFPSNRIRLSFTSLYSVSRGRNGVIVLNCDFDISVTGEPLSMMNLIGRSLTNAVTVNNSGPLFVDLVECIFCFTEWIVFGVQSSSPALLVSLSKKWFTFLFARQHLVKWPILPHFAHFFPLAGHSC